MQIIVTDHQNTRTCVDPLSATSYTMPPIRHFNHPNRDDFMQQPGAIQAKKIIQTQIAFGLLIIIVAFLLRSDLALSIGTGAGICIIANALLATWIFRDYRAQEVQRLTARFYWGEAIKIAIILGLFALATAVLINLNLPVMLGAYFATQVIPTVIAAHFGSQN